MDVIGHRNVPESGGTRKEHLQSEDIAITC